jgi:hypothetical protein
MKLLRVLTIAATLLLATLAGGATGKDLQALGCKADGVLHLLTGDGPHPGQVCTR